MPWRDAHIWMGSVRVAVLVCTAAAAFAAVWLMAGVVGLALAVVPLAAILILRHAAVRLLVIIGGGVYVFGSSLDLSPSKFIYSILVLLCAVVSANNLRCRKSAYIGLFRPLIWFSAAIVAVLIAGVLANIGASSLPEAGRNAIFLLLLPIAPVVGLDAAEELTERQVGWIAILIGVISAVGFGTDWLQRRGVSALPVGRFVLSSLLLPAYVFALALVVVALRSSILARVPWQIALVVIPISMLVTGTRTNLVLFVAAFGVVGAARYRRVPVSSLLRVLVGTIALLALLFPLVANAVVANPEFLDSRIRLLVNLGSGARGDESAALRLQQSSLAIDLIRQHPFFGVGVGESIPITLDTPLLTVVRLGVVGTLTVIAFLAASIFLIERSARQFGPSMAHSAFRGFVVVLIAFLPIGSAVEDHGFGFALILAFLGIGVGLRQGTLRIADRATPPDQYTAWPASPSGQQAGWAADERRVGAEPFNRLSGSIGSIRVRVSRMRASP